MFASVIIPNYNSASTISYTIRSVIDQNFDDYEIIVVNDGSTDNSVEICNTFFKIYPDLNLKIINKENGGLGSARNKGIENSQGDYLIFLDSDDLLPPKTLRRYYDAVQVFNADVVQGKMQVLNKSTVSWSKPYLSVINRTRLLDSENDFSKLAVCMSPCPRLYKRDFIVNNNIKFLEGVMMSEDHYFSQLIFSFKPNFLLLNYPTYIYRKDFVQQSTNTWKLSYLNDLLAVQQLLMGIISFTSDLYYKRFLSYDWKKRVIEGLTSCSYADLKAGVPIAYQILDLIPIEYKQKYLSKEQCSIHSEKSLYHFFTKKRILNKFTCRFIVKFSKRVYFFYLKKEKILLEKIFYFCSKLYTKALKSYRLKWFRFLYYVLSYFFSIRENKVTFAIRPSGKLYYLQEIKDILLQDNKVRVKTLLAKKVSLFEDLRIAYHLSRSKVILIDGHYWYLRGLTLRKNQFVIQCWHASGLLKKFGLDMFQKDTKEWYEQLQHHTTYSYALVSCDIATKGYMSAFNLDSSQILKMGNIVIDRAINNKITCEQAKFILNIPINKKLVLYAPTFREPYGKFTNIGTFVPKIDFSFLQSILGDDYVFAVRIHPNYKKINIPKNLINLSSEDETIVLRATDVLIADYSSIVFSYLVNQKPVVFFPYDLPEYESQRSTYEAYNEFCFGPIAYNQQDLATKIKSFETFVDYDSLKKAKNKYLQYCDGKTAIRLSQFIKEHLLMN